MRRRSPLPSLLLALVLACGVALAGPGASPAALPAEDVPFSIMRANPANRLAAAPLDPWAYDHATGCRPRTRPGIVRFGRWLAQRSRGQRWGVYRCERWGPGRASLHAESRAIDWHLRAWVPHERRDAERLIGLLLSADRTGAPAALARRMGVQGIIWDCRAWFGGAGLRRYGACYDEDGRRDRTVSPTIAHRDHLHLEMSKAGAAARTSWWAGASAVRGR